MEDCGWRRDAGREEEEEEEEEERWRWTYKK